MRVIETTAHIGDDGMLRLEIPTEQRNRDVQIALVVESAEPSVPALSEESKPIWEVFDEVAANLPPEVLAKLPTDGAENHDAYIYGKRRVSE